MRLRFSPIVTLLFALAANAWAHPETQEELLALSQRIQTQPSDPTLLMRRATCYEHEGEISLAEQDLEQAVALSPQSTDAHLQLVALLIANHRSDDAKKNLNRVIELDPKNVEALVWRARLHARANEAQLAYVDFARALAQIAEPPPELYFEQAALPVAPTEVLDGLLEGMRRLGPVVAISERAIALEIQLGRVDAAINHLDSLAAGAERKETYLKRRGDLLAANGRDQAARAAYLSALQEISHLPDWLRESNAMAQLTCEIQRSLSPSS